MVGDIDGDVPIRVRNTDKGCWPWETNGLEASGTHIVSATSRTPSSTRCWIDIEEDWKSERRRREADNGTVTLTVTYQWVCETRRRKWNEIKRNRKEQQQQSKKRRWQQKDEKCRKWKQRYKQQHWSKRDNKRHKKVKNMLLSSCYRPHTHTLKDGSERMKAGWSKGWWNKTSQHSPQWTENACKSSYLHDTERYIETVGPHIGGQEECLLQQGCQSKRHDPHGKRPQMCYGNIRDKCAKVAITTSKKEVSQKRTSPRRNLKTAESIKSHDDANARSVKRTGLKSATLNSKEKSSMTPKLQPSHRSWKRLGLRQCWSTQKELSMLKSQQHTIGTMTQTPQ